MENPIYIRPISENDTEAVLKIYEYYIRNSIISFEYEVPTTEDFSQRIKSITLQFPWLVCLEGDEIIGFAYAGKHRERMAYSWSADATVYLAQGFFRRGIARILYETLFSMLRLQGYFNVFAGVGLPNENSVKFHKAMGFEEIGTYKKVGFKHGNWHDTQWFQLSLTAHPPNPPRVKTIHEVLESPEFQRIISEANQKLNP